MYTALCTSDGGLRRLFAQELCIVCIQLSVSILTQLLMGTMNFSFTSADA